jgi:hypothetical protein
MAAIDTVVAVLHLAFAGIWTGSVLFAAWGVLPLASRAEIEPDALGFVAGRLTNVSRLSSFVLFATGGHLAGTRYTVETLTGSGRGHLVLTMVALWFVLTALVEVGSSRITDELRQGKIRTPARKARPFYNAAAVVALLLLLDAGLLLGGV